MNRREALKASGKIAGYTLLFGGMMTTIHACKGEPDLNWQPTFFTNAEAILVAEIA